MSALRDIFGTDRSDDGPASRHDTDQGERHMASWLFEVLEDCDFAGIPLRKGTVLVVRPGHATRPITAQLDLPPNYGMLLNLMADNSIIERDAFAGMRIAGTSAVSTADHPAPPLHPRRRRHLELLP